MKQYRILMLLCAVMLGILPAFGQMKVERSGKVLVGSSDTSMFDWDNVLTMSIRGKAVGNYAGSKLAFGDFNRRSRQGWNVFVGEYGTTDTDQLWLHGKNGIIFTNNNAMRPLAQIGSLEGGGWQSLFTTTLNAPRYLQTANDAEKEEVARLEECLSKVLQLGGIAYTTHTSMGMTLQQVDSLLSVSGLSAKEEASLREYRSMVEEGVKGDRCYGFLTSEVKKHFPDLVVEDKAGNSYVDYNGLLAVVVQALNEQQRTIEKLYAKVADCCGQGISYRNGDNGGTESKSGGQKGGNGDIDDGTTPILYQNSPNPFTDRTEIRYYVPQGATTTTIYLFTISGTLLQSYPTATMGNGSISIGAETLSAGMYVYSMVVDGQIVDTHRMILTE